MERVKLSNVIVRANTKVDKDNTDLIYYVGGEHFESGSITVEQKGTIAGSTIGPMFYYGFKAGQFLLVSRNPHLKKAGVVDFDGICSEKTFVLETADKSLLLPEYLPFVLQNDRFWKYAIEHKHGSTNFFINWATLANYEFDLPSIEEQKRLAAIAWAAHRLKKEYKKLIEATDAFVKSQFIEMFGDPVKNTMEWPTMTLAHATEAIVSGQCINGDAGTLHPGQKAVLKVSAVTYGFFDANEYKVIRDPNHITKGIYPKKGDLLFSRANTREYVGATALIEQDYPNLMLPDKLWKLVFKPQINPVFAKQFLSHPEVRKVLSSMATGTSGSMYNISMEKLKTLVIIVPEMELQQAFIRFVEQNDKSKFVVQKCSNRNLSRCSGIP